MVWQTSIKNTEGKLCEVVAQTQLVSEVATRAAATLGATSVRNGRARFATEGILLFG